MLRKGWAHGYRVFEEGERVGRSFQGPVGQRPSRVGKSHLSLEQRWSLPQGTWAL